MGLRSVDRGANFTAFLNCADEQNPANITYTQFVGGFANDMQAPSGRIHTLTPAAATAQWGRFHIDEPLAQEYYGRFSMFLRARQLSGTPGNVTFQLDVSRFGGGYAEIYQSETFTFSSLNDFQVFDCGGFVFPRYPSIHQVGDFYITIRGIGDAAAIVHLYDLALIPTDEWALDCRDTIIQLHVGMAGFNYSHLLTVDSVTAPKRPLYLIMSPTLDPVGRTIMSWQGITVEKPILLEGTRQRLHLIAFRKPSTTTDWQSEPWSAYSVTLTHVQQYLSMRGGR